MKKDGLDRIRTEFTARARDLFSSDAARRIRERACSLFSKIKEEASNYKSIFKRQRDAILSLDIGRHNLKIAFLSFSKDKAELQKYAIKELPVDNQQQDNDRILVEFLRDFVAANCVTEKDVIVSLQDTAFLATKRLVLPVMPEQEMKEAIKWEIKGEIPFDVNQTQIDWQSIREYTDKDGAKKRDIILLCAQKDALERYVELVKKAGLNVIGIKTAPFNYSCIAGRTEAAKKGIVALLDIGFATSSFCIYSDGALCFLRSLPFGSDQLTASMKGVLSSEAGTMELSREKAEEIKREYGIPRNPADTLKDGIKASHIISLIRPVMERLVSEIKRSVAYYMANFESGTPKVLYITGGGSNLKGMDLYLKEELAYDVEKLDLTKALNIGRDIDKTALIADAASLASPAGAAYGIMRRPNFLPEEYRAEKIERLQSVSLRLTAGLVTAAFLFSLLAARIKLNDYNNRLVNAEMHLQAIDGLRRLNNKVAERHFLASSIRHGKMPPVWILKELSRIMPSGGVLERLEFDRDRRLLKLEGYIVASEEKAEDELIGFVKELGSSVFLEEASLSFSLKASYKDRDARKFEIRCNIPQ